MFELETSIVDEKNKAFVDQKKMKTLFVENFESLVNYCRSIVKDDSAAKDIVQDAFISLWENKDLLETDKHIQSFLFTVVKNQSINYLKHQKLRFKYAKSFKKDYQEAELRLIAVERDVSTILEIQEVRESIEKAILELPLKCREVICLSRKQNFKNKEIAEKMSISEKMVEAHITKALKYIKTKILP